MNDNINNAITKGELYVASVLSGNRNFEGRVHPQVKANYLASPPLVVAYAIAGSMMVDLYKDSLGKDKSGKDVFLKDIWPSNKENTGINCYMNHFNIIYHWNTFYSSENEEINDELLNILLDDLNTPKFITNIHSLYNKAKTGDITAKKDLNSALKFIGLFNQSEEQFNSLRKKSNLDVGQIENLIDLRNLARKNKDFKKADKIRLDLEKNGILIEDFNDKTHWKHK